MDKKTEKQRIDERFSIEDILREELKLDVGRDGKVAEGQIAAEGKNAGAGPRRLSKARSEMNSRKHGFPCKFPLVEAEEPQKYSQFDEEILAKLKPEGAIEKYFADVWIKETRWLELIKKVVKELLINPESLGDLSLSEIFNHLKFVCSETARRFDEIPEIFNFLKETKRSDANTQGLTQNKADVTSSAESRLTHTKEFLRASAEMSSSELILEKHLNDRLYKASLVVDKAQSSKTSVEADGATAEDGALATETAVNRMARSFTRNREALLVASRFQAMSERSRNNALHELERLQAARRGRIVAAPEMVDVNVSFTGKKGDGA